MYVIVVPANEQCQIHINIEFTSLQYLYVFDIVHFVGKRNVCLRAYLGCLAENSTKLRENVSWVELRPYNIYQHFNG